MTVKSARSIYVRARRLWMEPNVNFQRSQPTLLLPVARHSQTSGKKAKLVLLVAARLCDAGVRLFADPGWIPESENNPYLAFFNQRASAAALDFDSCGNPGAGSATVMADRKQGAVLLIELPQDSTYTSFEFDLHDPQNKLAWTKTVSAASAGASANGTLSLVIPGAGLHEGAYTIAITGLNAQGERSAISRQVLDILFDD